MRICIHRLCLPLILLLLLLGFAAQASAQGHTFNQLSHSPKLRDKTGKTHNAIADAASDYEVLYSFCLAANCTDGEFPVAGLIRDAAGNLYGTTSYGGANTSANGGAGGGTVFKVDSTGHETVLYSFCSAAGCADGGYPVAGLTQDAAGTLYGTTEAWGGNGHGTVFKVDNADQETVLYSFCSAAGCADGSGPYAGLIQDAAGNLYGTTAAGGANTSANGGAGGGTVFKVDSTGHETVLYSFCSESNCADGYFPLASVTQDAAGNLYGTTAAGGANTGANYGRGGGTVFKLDNAGHYTVLYSFCSASGCTDGEAPEAGLTQDAAGNLYGTTMSGGGNGDGTVFKLDTTGHETVLYGFCSEGDENCTDGNAPLAGLIQDAAGNLYGTTRTGGGAEQGGTVFKLDTTGHETVLYSFCSEANCADGYEPLASLIQDGAGNLYGTANFGGANSSTGSGGTVFKLAGVAAPPSFTLAGTAVSVTPGATTGNSSTITVTPSGGFTGSVTLTAVVTSSPAGAQDLPTLSFGSTSPVSITSNAARTATLTISSTAATSAALAYPVPPRVRWYAVGGMPLTFILLVGIPAQGRSWRTRLGVLVFVATLTGGLVACGGGNGGGTSSRGTTPGTYTVTVSGTSGSITATGTVSIAVE